MSIFKLISISVVLTFLVGCSRATSEPENTSIVVQGDRIKFAAAALPDSITIDSVVQQGATPLALTGRIVWDEDRTVRIFTPFAGRVTKILAGIGDTVAQGQVLAIVESPDYGAAQADYRKASAEFSVAKSTLERTRDLYEHGVVAAKELQQAEADAASAAAEAQRTERLLMIHGDHGDSIDQQLSLRSPIAGVIVERAINPGQELRPDQTSPAQFVVTDPTHLWLQLDAREDDLEFLKPHTRFEFKTAAYPNDTFSAEVLRVADYVDTTSRTIKVLATAENRNRRLKSEFFITATIMPPKGALAEAPASAVFLVGNKYYAFVREGDSFVRRELHVGPERAGHVPIIEGAKPGDIVVSHGALYLQQTLQVKAHG